MAIDYKALGAEVAKTQKANDDARRTEMQHHLKAAMMSKVPDADRKGFDKYLEKVGGLANLIDNRITPLRDQTDTKLSADERKYAKLAVQVMDEADKLYFTRAHANDLASKTQTAAPTAAPTGAQGDTIVTFKNPEAARSFPGAPLTGVVRSPELEATGPAASAVMLPKKSEQHARPALAAVAKTVENPAPAPAPQAAAAPQPQKQKEQFPLSGREQEAFTTALEPAATKINVKPAYIKDFINQLPGHAIDAKLMEITASQKNPKKDSNRPQDKAAAKLYDEDLKNAAAVLKATKEQVKILEAKQAELDRQEQARAKQLQKQADEAAKATAHRDALRAEETRLRADAAAKRPAAYEAADAAKKLQIAKEIDAQNAAAGARAAKQQIEEEALKLARAKEIDAANHAVFAKADITALERAARPDVHAALTARQIDAQNAAAAKEAANHASAPTTAAVVQRPAVPAKPASTPLPGTGTTVAAPTRGLAEREKLQSPTTSAAALTPKEEPKKLTDPRLVNALEQAKLTPEKKEAVTDLLAKLSDPDLSKMQTSLERHLKTFGKKENQSKANSEQALAIVKAAHATEVKAALAVAPAPAPAVALALPVAKPTPATGKVIYTPEAGDGWTNVAQADNKDMRSLRDVVRKELGKKASPRDVLNVLGLALAHGNGAENIDKLKQTSEIHEISVDALKHDIAALKQSGRISKDGHIAPGALPRELAAIFPEGPAATPAVAQTDHTKGLKK